MSELTSIVDKIIAEGGTSQDIGDAVRKYEKVREEQEAFNALIPAWNVQVAACYARDGYVCAYCEDTEGPFTVDHVLARIRGGTNDLSNLVVACRSCNASKRHKLLADWGGRNGNRRRLPVECSP